MNDLLKTGISLLVSEGQYFCLFLVALLALFYLEKRKDKMFIWYMLSLACLVIFPLTAFILAKYQTYFYLTGHIGVILPIAIVIAYGSTHVFSYLFGLYKSKLTKGLYPAIAGTILGFLALLILSGNVALLPKVSEQTGTETVKSYQVIDEALDMLPKDTNVCLLASDEVMGRARIYDKTNIILPYGRNMWEPETIGYTFDSYPDSLVLLHAWINEIRSNEYAASLNDQMLSYILTTDIEYCAFSKYRLIVGGLKDVLDGRPEYYLYAENDDYVIYAVNKDYNSMPDTGWVATSYADITGNQALFYTLYNNEDGTLIVIDGGWTENAVYVRKIINELGGHVDAWFITHFHNDHADAFSEIFADPQGITIDAVYAPDYPLDEYKAVAKEWDNVDSVERFLSVTDGAENVYHPDRDSVFEYNGLTISLLNTYDDFLLQSGSGDLPNDTSFVLRIDGSAKSMLIVGDCHTYEFSKLFLTKYADAIDVDFVQAGHHGNNSLPTEFYDLTSPETVIFDGPVKVTQNPKYTAIELREYLTEKGAVVVDYQSAPNHFCLD